MNALEDLQHKLNQIESITEITGFTNPLEAFEYAKENPVDVAFLDIEIYEMSGIEMAKQIKSIQPKANIVYVTGYSQYAVDAFGTEASDYLLKPVTVERIEQALHRLRNPIIPRLRVQTFGNFEVFVDGEILRFSRGKSKELFAYLIHKNGTSCTIKELAAALFEDNEDVNIQTYISTMMKVFDGCGIKDVIKKDYNSIAVDVEAVDCDLYRALSGDSIAKEAFIGEYMASYAWAEQMAAYLETRLK